MPIEYELKLDVKNHLTNSLTVTISLSIFTMDCKFCRQRPTGIKSQQSY